MKLFTEITKVDEEQRMVWGVASTESVDSQGETVKADAMKAAWDDYMKFANVREMHQPSAVGIVKEYAFSDTGVEIGVKVVDDAAWTKVKEGVYKGFSIGGKKLKDGYDKVTKTITGLKLTEISLVDRPANPDALITVYKADDADMTDETAAEESAPVAVTPELLKAVSTSAEFQALIAAEVAKAMKAAQPKPEPSELRKAFRALKDPESIEKGMYDVRQLSDAVQSLTWLQQSCAAEAQYEGDNSPVPGKLADATKALAAILVEMATEECAELMATLKADNAIENLAGLLRTVPTDEIAKRDTEAVTKLADVTASLEKMASECADLRKAVETVTAERDDFKKKFEEKPAEPKGQLISIEKVDDVNPALVNKDEVEPVLKENGEVDKAATEIKKIYQGGGRRIF